METLKCKYCDLPDEVPATFIKACNCNQFIHHDCLNKLIIDNQKKCKECNTNYVKFRENDETKCSIESIIYGVLAILMLAGGIILIGYSKEQNIIVIIIVWIVYFLILTILLIKYRLSLPLKYNQPLLFPYTTYGAYP
jgi:hypothetical protein